MEDSKYSIGSLFDGISGFPLVASWYGIAPIWASEIEQSCVRITSKHFPNMKHYGDITKMKGDEIEPVDVLTGGFPCFPAGTMILSDKGYVPIEDIKVGDIVLTHNNRWRPVTEVGSKEAPTYRLKGNITIETTENHPIYSADVKNTYPRRHNGKRTTFKDLANVGEWTEAIYMAGKQWATPYDIETLDVPKPPSASDGQKEFPEMNSDFWYFVGRWLGDGWVRNSFRKDRPNGDGHGQIILCDSHDKEQELVSIVSKISENYNIERCRTAVKVKFVSQILCNWLVEHFGKGAMHKTIPAWVMSLPIEHRSQILKGITDSDGHHRNDHTVQIASISKQLILGIRLLGESLGYTTSVSYCKRPETHVIEGRVVNQHDTYTVALCKSCKRRTGIESDGHKWYKCRSVEATGETKRVYNFSVEEDESYIADSIVVHNCTDMSVAGKQAGIKYECHECGTKVELSDNLDNVCPNCGAELHLTRSGLFMEQIRIIKEMREKTNGRFPKLVVAENVAGCLSSNNGDDFYTVLKEFCGLLGQKLPAFRPEKWTYAGEILADTGSIAWRTLDAQYWGVPQRRRRIFLVIDFGGERASEILFKQESLRRYPTSSRASWKRIAGKAKDSTETTDSNSRNELICVATQQTNAEIMIDKSPTLTEANGTSGSNRPYIVLDDQGGQNINVYTNDVIPTLRAETHGHVPCILNPDDEESIQVTYDTTVYGICSLGSNCMKSDNPNSGFYEADVVRTLDTSGTNPSCNQGGNVVVQEPVYCLQGNGIDRADTAGCNGKGWTEDVCYTLNTIDRPAVVYDEVEKPYVAAFAHQTGSKLPMMPYNEELSPTLNSHQTMAVVISENTKVHTLIEQNQTDARYNVCEDNVCQTLTARMGTGGGHVPVVVEETVESFAESGFGTYDEGVCGTLHASGGNCGGGSETIVSKGADNCIERMVQYVATTRNPVLRLLQETYGAETILKWGIAVMAALQSADVLQSRMYDSSISRKTEDRGELDNIALPCPEFVVKWILQDMRKQQECGCTSQGSQSEEQRHSEFTKIMQELSPQTASSCECLFNMWKTGEGIWILRQTLSEIQEAWQSSCSNEERQNSIVRRLTPLEAERLQGFPDNWTAGESDANRYKALGNSVALPCVDYIMRGVREVLEDR